GLDASITVIDFNTYKFIFVNKYAREAFGIQTGMSCYKILSKKRKRPCKSCFKEKLIDLEGIRGKRCTWTHFNEKERKWYQFNEKAMKWIDGSIVKLQVGYDITATYEAEKKLKESEENYKLLISEQGEGIGITDTNEVISFANPAAERIFGVEPGKLVNKSLNEFTTPAEFDRLKKETQLRAQGTRSTYETEIITPSGQRKILHLTATPKYDKNGNFEGTFGVFRDITAEKIIEENLRLSEERFKRFAEVTHEGIFIHRNGKIVDVNPAVLKMFGYTEEEVKNKEVWTFITPLNERFIKSQVSSEMPEKYEFNAIRKDGSVFPVAVKVSPLIIGDVVYKVVSVNDITKIKKAEKVLRTSEKKLREANQTKDKFFTVLAHDLRGPVSNLMQFAKLMDENYEELSEEEIKEYIGYITRLSGQTYNLLENLLTWSRIQLDRIDLTPEEIPLNGLIKSVLKMMKDSISRKDLDVNFHGNGDIYVFANGEAIELVLRNLLSNAIKFTPMGGSITISMSISRENESNAKFVNVFIDDTGMGIPRDKIGELFDIGTLYSTEGTNNEKGTGLGLILCKEFVEKNGGSISVESKLGTGSTFCFSLPLKRP
ncbi:MAG: PAS domain S-box protein, partial [Bacteroidia bacterium]